jgi:hypothetical protein
MVLNRILNILIVAFLLLAGYSVYSQDYFELKRLSFNTQSKELAPTFYKNGLVFCSDKRNDFLFSYTDLDDNPLTNLYYAEQKKPGKFENPQLFSKNLTTFLFEGPASFSKDGKTVYFTRTNDVSVSFRNRQREDTTFGIFRAEIADGEWTNITPFRYNRTDCNVGHPNLSADGTQLYFCMDDPEGYGGYDIYVSNLKDGQWGNPQNLGPNVNTSKNEVFPFLHSSGRLYFASRGYTPRADLDIYYTVNTGDGWAKPVALKEPFNSPNDDYGLILNAAMDTGYFVSDRAKSADIYLVFSTMPTFPACKPQEENDYCYVFFEPNNNELDTTAFAYEWDLGDGTKIRALEAEHCFAGPGTYLVQLNVVDKLTKEVYFSQASHSYTLEKIEQPYINSPDTAYVDEEIRMDGHETYLKNFDTDGYYWDFGDGTRANLVETSHKYMLPGTYSIQLGVTGRIAERNEQVSKQCSTRKIVILSRNSRE